MYVYRLLTALLVAVGIFLPRDAQAQVRPQGGLGVSPLLLQQLPGVVTIQNGESVPARLQVSLQDFEQDSSGSNRFLPMGTSPASCAGRARLAPVPAVLGPGASVNVRVDVLAGPVCWGVVMVEASKDAHRGNRVAVKFFHVPAGATRSAEIADLQAVSGPRRAVMLVVRSRGTAPVRPFGRLEFRTEAGGVVGSADVAEFGLLPGAERYLLVPVPAQLPPGRYVVVAVLDAGAVDYIAAQAVVDLAPGS